MTRGEREGFIWILLAAAGFSVMPTMVKLTYLHSTFEPMDIAIWRFVIAAPLMWALVLFGRRPQRSVPAEDLPVTRLLVIGVLIAAAVLAAFFALERLPGSMYIVLLYSYPAMVALLSRLLGEEINPRTWLALGLALIGVALTVPNFASGAGGDAIGLGLALLNAAIIALYYLLTRRALAGVVDVSRSSAVMMVSTLFIMLMLIPLRGLQLPQNPLTLFLLFCIGVFGTVLPVYGVNIAVQRIGAAQASLVSTIEPPMSMIVSVLILSEVILPLQWLGAALIVGSVIVLQLRPRNRIDLSIAHEAG
ncbi:MAG: DMT family transporter [Chloroflexi bacterium]|nr:DMT family transporter [Chloroflexota bacterium]